jgi:hypothetical protein
LIGSAGRGEKKMSIKQILETIIIVGGNIALIIYYSAAPGATFAERVIAQANVTGAISLYTLICLAVMYFVEVGRK